MTRRAAKPRAKLDPSLTLLPIALSLIAAAAWVILTPPGELNTRGLSAILFAGSGLTFAVMVLLAVRGDL